MMRRVTSDEIIYSPRIASMLERYHTWPTIQRQTIADHTFNILRIWVQLWGAPRSEVTESIVAHDMGEMGPGDVPFGGKRRSPELKKLVDELEEEHQNRMWGSIGCVELTDNERRRIKLCDLLEMWEFGKIEENLGNMFAQPIVDDVWRAVVDIASNEELEKIMETLVRGGHRWHRST